MPLYANAGFLPFLRNLLCSRSRMLKKVMWSRCSLRLAVPQLGSFASSGRA